MTNLSDPITFFEGLSRLDIVGILLPSILSFFIGVAITPIIAGALYRNRVWKPKSVAKSVDGKAATITQKLHNDEKRKVPRMGGSIAIVSVMITIVVFWLLARISDTGILEETNILNRNQTWLPVFTLITGALLGAVDDLAVSGKMGRFKLGRYVGGGLSLKTRLAIVGAISLASGYWFYDKLDVTSVYIPFWQSFDIGLLMIPFILVVMVATYSGGVIDGVDGLSGGVFSIMFGTYGLISLMQGMYDLAALCTAIVGGLLAFLWFNIPPARFYLSEVGTMPLTLTLSLLAFITDTAFLLPIIAFPLLISTGSVIIQVLSKKYRGKKVFTVSPIHNHFQANGWPGPKVTMRYWVMSQVMAISGLVIYILGY